MEDAWEIAIKRRPVPTPGGVALGQLEQERIPRSGHRTTALPPPFRLILFFYLRAARCCGVQAPSESVQHSKEEQGGRGCRTNPAVLTWNLAGPGAVCGGLAPARPGGQEPHRWRTPPRDSDWPLQPPVLAEEC